MRRLPEIALAALAAVLVAVPAAGAGGRLALFDDRHAPLVLVESGELAPPPAVTPNRFVRGWLGWRRPDQSEWLVPGPLARLELVELEPRPRRLLFDGELLVPGEAWAEVRIGAERRRVAIADRFSVELPPAAGPGRRIVDLRLKPEAAWAASSVRVEPALAPGAVSCDARGCRQSGPSAFESVRRVAPGTLLSGVFVPPARPRPGQRFRVSLVEEDGRERALFRWRPPSDGSARARQAFTQTIVRGERPRWVRLRFTASGEGPPATWRRLRLAGAGSPPQPRPPVPAPPRLVVLYVMDALRADHVTHLGGEAGLSPVIDRLAAAGATFRRHQSVAPNTRPSTKALFTGVTYLQRGGWKMGPQRPRTLAEAFLDAGHRTAIFSDNANASSIIGAERGFEHVGGVLDDGGPAAPAGYNDSARRVHRAALSWLSRLGSDESAFIYLHTLHPHTPYAPPPDLEERFARGGASRLPGSPSVLLDIDRGRRLPTAADRRRLARLYAASVAYNDREIGRFLAALERSYLPEEVLFVLTSDHGEELFDHGGVLHGYTLYEELLRVPLIVRWPGTVAPEVVEAATVTTDVHDALRAMVDAERAARRPGFWRRLAGGGPDGPEPEVQFAAASALPGGIFSARSERWKLIWAPRHGLGWGMGAGAGRSGDPEYLFDLDAGVERVNRAGESFAEADWLRSRLAAWVRAGLAAEVGDEEPALDEAARRRLRALGYLD